MNLSDFFSNYYTVRAEMLDAVKNMTQEQLDWKCPQHSNTVGKLLAHIAEAEYWWITIVAAQKVAPSKKAFERFETARTLEETMALLAETLGDTREYLEKEGIEDWDEVFYEVKGRKEKVSKRWLVWHTVEHQARHRGHIFMLMRMQGLDVPNV